MSTMKIRWLGAKKPRIVDLPIGLSAIGDKYGEVVCDPVGEFPIGEGRKLLALPGANTLFVPEDEYQKAHPVKAERAAPKPAAPAADVEAKKAAQRERGRKLAALQQKKRQERENEKQAAAGA